MMPVNPESQPAPVVVFSFNRPGSLKRTLTALADNPRAQYTPLIIYVDGPRYGVEGEAEKVAETRSIASRADGFGSVEVHDSPVNKGLAPSVISGVSEVMERYGRCIVVEDDLIVSKSFLEYMNGMLTEFRDDPRVMQISGYGALLSRGLGNYFSDVYLNGRAQSWTWATWADRWATVDWDVTTFPQLRADKRLQRDFCRHGSDLYGMLRDYMEGRNNSWFVRFCYSMHLQGRYCVCPVRSLVVNEGFTAEATHCNAYNRYKVDFEREHQGGFILPPEGDRLEPDETLMREAVKYWSIPWRIYGKLRTILKI